MPVRHSAVSLRLRSAFLVASFWMVVLAAWPRQVFPAQQSAQQGIYVSDFDNHRIVMMKDMTGLGWTAYGRRGSGVHEFKYPKGIFVDDAGRIYIADSDNNRIVRINNMRGDGWIALPTDSPQAVFLDQQGRIYTSERVDDMTGAGRVSLPGVMATMYGIHVDREGRIYGVDFPHDSIVRIDSITGAGLRRFGAHGGGPGQFHFPFGIFVDSRGRIYVTDGENKRVVRIDDMTGAGWTELGGLFCPSGIALDSVGRIYISECGPNGHIIRVDDMIGAGRATFGRDFFNAFHIFVIPWH